MNEYDDTAHGHPRSTARIGTHPIHPMLVPFPIVCFIGVFTESAEKVKPSAAMRLTMKLLL